VKQYKAHGFTIIELIMVLALMGILGLAIITRNMPLRSSFDLSSLGDQLILDIRYTQILSLTLNGSYSIAINANNYQIKNPDGTNFNYPAVNSNPVTLPTGVTLSPVQTITFGTNGRPSNAATITLSVAGLSRTLTLRAQTGFIDG
jgi:prepilin-type N-terminal cleavage/methylation domain-containing protein